MGGKRFPNTSVMTWPLTQTTIRKSRELKQKQVKRKGSYKSSPSDVVVQGLRDIRKQLHKDLLGTLPPHTASTATSLQRPHTRRSSRQKTAASGVAGKATGGHSTQEEPLQSRPVSGHSASPLHPLITPSPTNK